MTTMNHRGYQGTIEADVDEGFLYGQILFITDLVNYEGASVPELKAAFQAAVDDYLAMCARVGKSPDKPFSGAFNVRTGPELHRLAALKASSENTTLNSFVVQAIQRYVDEATVHNHVHKHEVVVVPNAFSVTAGQTDFKFFNMSTVDEQATLSQQH